MFADGPLSFGEKRVGIKTSLHTPSTNTVTEAVSEHPLVFVPVNTYLVVANGFAIGVGHALQFKVDALDQEYEFAPLADN